MSEGGVEYGGCARFANAKLVGSDGNEMFCKCGKSAAGGILGKGAYSVYCEMCDLNRIAESHEFIYKPPICSDSPKLTDDLIVTLKSAPIVAQDASLGVKFSQGARILDPWWIIGGTRWSRTLFRLKHPIVYSKRGIRSVYRRIKRLIFGDPPMVMCRKRISKEEAMKHWPSKHD